MTVSLLPTISEFFGIAIRMYFDDHGTPHFHAHYGEYSAVISIESLAIMQGQLPKRALALVLEWANEHRSALEENWKRAMEHKPLRPIEPLD